jgi:hypothetical protein
VDLLTPSVLDRCTSILWGAELGGRRPSELMDSMLATLPAAEPAGELFKTVFLHRLPEDMKDLVAVQFNELGARDLALYADAIWDARNAKRKPVAAVAADLTATDELQESSGSALEKAVAALALLGKRGGRKGGRGRDRGRRGRGGQSRGEGQRPAVVICERHLAFGKDAWNCDAPATCQWPGNE